MDSSSEEVDLYEVLEIERGASKSEIKKAYHKVRFPIVLGFLS